MNDNQIEKTVPIKVDECAARAPARLCREESARLGFVTKRAVTLIAVQDVSPPLRHEQVYISMVVDIAGTDTLTPPGMCQARLFRHIFELQAP